MRESIQTRRRRSARSIALILTLVTAVALVASWFAAVVVAWSGAADLQVDFENRGPAYYLAHGMALLAVMAAGMLAAARGRFELIRLPGRIAMVIIMTGALIWAVASYSLDQLLSTTVFGATGPFVWLTLVFVLAGTDRRVWTLIDPLLQILAYVTSVLAIFSLLRPDSSAYIIGYSRNTALCILLMWLGGWTLLTAVEMRGWRLALRAMPIVLMILLAIQGEARSWVLQGFLVTAAFLILRGHRQGHVILGVRNVVLAGALTIAVGFALSHTVFNQALEGIAQRLGDDTRSMQYRDFFSVVPVSDLVLGRGPTGTWYWYGIGEYQFFDNGFLWMLFIGGLPTLLPYVVFVIWPAAGALTKKPKGDDAAAVWLVLFWAIALMGLSTYTLPSVGFSSYLVSLYAGRCHLILAESDYRKKRFAERRRLYTWAPRAVAIASREFSQ